MRNLSIRGWIAAAAIFIGAGVITSLLVGLITVFPAANQPVATRPTATVQTGSWTPTCGGFGIGTCTKGALEVTFADGSKTNVDWNSRDTRTSQMVVTQLENGTWVAGDKPAPEKFATTTAAQIIFLVLIPGIAGVFLTAAFVAERPHWAIAYREFSRV